MNKMEKMQEDIRLLQRQMTNYACSNIKIGDKIYICGHKIVPDGYYFITNRDPTVVGVMPYSFKLNYGRGNWVNPQTCDVFKLITPEVTTGKPLTDYMEKHIYEEGDCFRFSDNSSHKLINNGYDEGLLVSLVKDGISWGKLFALNNKIVEDQVEFEKYLKDCRLTYIGIVDKVYFKIRRIS